tara:strand:+ start:135 stop:446 length:312 start_codon:yes stop_codon:yes gene_type:complete
MNENDIDDIDNIDSYSFNPDAPMAHNAFLSKNVNQREVDLCLKVIKRVCNKNYTPVDYISDSMPEGQISLAAAKELLRIIKPNPNDPELKYLEQGIKWAEEQA